MNLLILWPGFKDRNISRANYAFDRITKPGGLRLGIGKVFLGVARSLFCFSSILLICTKYTFEIRIFLFSYVKKDKNNCRTRKTLGY